MKRITRKVTYHVYEFGTLDIEKGTVSITRTVEQLEPMTKQQIFRYTQQHDCVLVRESTRQKPYSMSTAYFVECAKEYARQNGKPTSDESGEAQEAE